MKMLAWFGRRILRNRPYSWFILGFLALVAVIGFANADTLVAPIQWTAPPTVLRVTPADVPDSAAWGVVYKRCPAVGCVVEMAGGTYTVIRSWNKPGLLVVRAADPADRPQVRGGAGCGGHQTAWSGVVVENVDFLPGAGEVTSLPRCDFLRLDGVTIDGKTNNGVHLSNSDRTIFELEDSEITRSGQGNTKHNLYIGRIPSALFIGLVSHSSKGSHALKSIARVNEVRDSWLGTVAPGQAIEAAGPFVSTTLADLVACGQSLIENVTFDHVQTAKTGNQVLAYRSRNSILGCDEPPYGKVWLWDTRNGPVPDYTADFVTDPLYTPNRNNRNIDGFYVAGIARGPLWAPGFWNAPVPAEFRHIVRNARFIERGQPNRAVAITVEGTAPVVVSRSFGPELALPQPPGWVERSRIRIGEGVTFEGQFRALIVSKTGEGGE